MVDEKKGRPGLTYLHLYFLIIAGLLMFVSSNIEYRYVDSLLSLVAGVTFLTTLLIEQFTKKIDKEGETTPKALGLIGSFIGALIGGIFSVITNIHFFIFTYNIPLIQEPRSTRIFILSILVGIITGAIVGFFLNYITMKHEFKPLAYDKE